MSRNAPSGASTVGRSPGADDGRPERENMTTLKFENNKIYSTSTLCEKTDVFEIVEKIPVNFFVWNIGENMGTHEYIPVCEDLHPEDKDNYEINTKTLKTVKVTPDHCRRLFYVFYFLCCSICLAHFPNTAIFMRTC